jgi:ABC-type nitrate/sulfonate/bicarbonate transport system substrate-binding protein
MKRILTCLIFVGAVWWISAPTAGAQTTTLRVGFNGFYGAAPLYIAQDAAIFRKHGIALEMIFIAGGSLSTQALIGKSLELLLTGGPPFSQRLRSRRAAQDHRRRDEYLAVCPHHREPNY